MTATATAKTIKTTEKAAPKSRRLSLVEPKSEPVAEYVEFRGVTHLTVALGTERRTFCGKFIPKSAKFGDETISGLAATCKPCHEKFAPAPATEAKASRIAPSTAKTAAEVADLDQVTRLNLAKSEADAKKAWKAAGSTGDAPATPVLDWMNSTPKSDRKSAAKKGDGSTKRYDATTTAELIERVRLARSTGISFPKLATILNEEGYHGAGWTGPKLYALACRHDVGKLPLVKSVEPKAVKAAAPKKATEPKVAAKSSTKAPSTKSLAALLPKTGRKPAAKK